MLKLDFLTDNTNLKRIDAFVALLILRILYRCKKISNDTKKKFKISRSTWNEEFEKPDGSHSLSDI